MSKTKSILSSLEGTHVSIEACNQLAEHVIASPEYLPELVFGLWHADSGVRSRAADTIEKVTAKRPELLQPFKKELLGLLPCAKPAAMRWHLAQILPRLVLSDAERQQAIEHLKCYLADKSSIVKTFAMDGLMSLASTCDEAVRKEITQQIRILQNTGTPAMKARARKMLAAASQLFP